MDQDSRPGGRRGIVQIYMNDAQQTALAEGTAATGMTASALIKTALRAYLAEHGVEFPGRASRKAA